jgi:hypothetical protein
MEYYAAHGKKVRRKRVRLPSVSSGAMLGIPGKTLGSQGWAVRYDWKAGWFAELRGEMVEARRYAFLHGIPGAGRQTEIQTL